MVMSAEHYHITALAPTASFVDALRTHWREYLMEAAELAFFMLCVCTAGTILYERNSPLNTLGVSGLTRSILMGVAISIASYTIIRSPFGRRSGAHFNPALTFAYFGLGRVHRWDALAYILAQFIGGFLGVLIAHALFGASLAGLPVRYVVTLPGRHGYFLAFLAEFLASFILMEIVLVVSNHRRLAKYSPLFVAIVTVCGYALSGSISGYSVNPARSFSSASFARVWNGIWIYFVAPGLGMLTAAALYKNVLGIERIYCAKVFHDLRSVCPFDCRFEQLQSGSQNKVAAERTQPSL
jgi:aquaporin Z